MAKTDYITSGNFRLMVYQSDIISPSTSDPHVNVTVYFQVSSAFSGESLHPGAWSASLLNGTYTASGSQEIISAQTWSGWKTLKTVFSSKGIWSVNKTRTSFNVSFSMPTFSYGEEGETSVSLSGTVSMAAWPSSGTKDTASVPSSMTMGSAYTISITHKTSGNKNTLTYAFGGASGTILSSSTATSVSFTPPTSLGAKIPSANSGTITFTLTTYNSSGVSLGSTTYTSTLSVPSYSLSAPTVSAAKSTYTGVGAYVANKTKTRFTLSGLPSGSYGATVTGSYVIVLGSAQQTSGSKTGTSSSTVDYTASAAGVLKLTYTIRDSRGKTASASASVTYVANAAPMISFSVARSSSPTTSWSGTASGTYLNVSGNTATVTFSSGTAGTATVGSGSFSRPVSGTGLAETSSLTVKATITDTLGNTASISKTISTVFAYIEATPNKVIAIGRKASTSASNKVQIGLPTEFDAGAQGVIMLSASTAVDSNSYTGKVINLGQVPRADLGLETSATVPDVITAWLKYVCVRYPNATDCIFDGIAFVGSRRMIRCYVYDTSAVSGGLPQYSSGELLSYDSARWYFRTYAYNIYTYQLADYVVERGTSDGWTYRKWKSGAYECWRTVAPSIAINSAWGSNYYGTLSAYDYPVTFSERPYEQVSVRSGSGWAWIVGGTTISTTSKTGAYYLMRSSSASSQQYYIDYYVRGYVSS